MSETPSTNSTSSATEEIDKLLEQEDPAFSASLQTIKKDAIEDNTEIESFNLEVEEDGESPDARPITKWPKKVFLFLTFPIRWFIHFVKWRFIALKNRFKLFAKQTWHFIKNDLPDLIRYFVSQLKAGLLFLVTQVRRFLALSRGQKLALVGSLIFAISSVALLSKSLTGNWLPMWGNPLIRGFHETAQFVKSVRTPEEYVEFFASFPEIEFYLQLSRIVVNLKPSPGIPNPMGTFEFYLGLDANETAIEVKDREKEILDITQRTIEEFTYPEVMSPNTQKRVWARVRDNINEVLNQGRVQKVYVKTLITYRQ